MRNPRSTPLAWSKACLRFVLYLLFPCLIVSETYAQQTIYSYSVPGGGYAPNGNLTAVADTANGQWADLQYDSLNRLISGNLTRGTEPKQYYCWAYDSFGNRKVQQLSDQPFQTATGTDCQTAGTLIANVITTPDSSNRIQSTNAYGVTIAPIYDGGGNMTFDGRYQVAYDAENRVCAVLDDGGNLTQYLYNAEGQRVARGHSKSGNTLACPQYGDFAADTKYILGQSGEQVSQLNGSDQWGHTNVWANGQLLATYDPQGLHFNISDPLGTKRLQASATGALEVTFASLPYGDGLTTSGVGTDATEHHFTGKERDAESGLDYFGARYYGSSIGRFMSPDPSGLSFADPTNPQSLNLYTYVLNNPLKFTDPSGMACVWDDGSFDSEDDQDTGSSGQCHKAGGTWLDKGATASLSGGQDWSNKADSYIADAANFSSANVNANDTPWGYSDMENLWNLWNAGSLPQQINYGPWDQQTIAMSHDFAVNRARSAYIKAGCPGSAPIAAGHYEATADHMGSWALGMPDYTQIEVGGYSGTITGSGDTATFTVNNTMSMSSLNAQSTFTGGHSTDNPHGPSGPQHNVQQTFQWQESGLCHK